MDVQLPQLGEGADSGVVVSILVKPGESVNEGQPLLEIENEKAVAPIPAPVSGVVSRIGVKTGDRVSVGQVLMAIGASDEGTPKSQTDPVPQKVTKAPTSAVTPTVDEGDETEAGSPEALVPSGATPTTGPSIRRLARELGIDLARVRGSERGGRIVMADVRDYILRLQKKASDSPTKSAASAPKATLAEAVDFSKWGGISKKPMSQLRKVISRRMTENWTTIPHVTQFAEADITVPMELRKKWAASYESKGVRLTLTPILLKALAATLQRHPIFNASLDEASEEIVFKQYYHIGIAVDTEAGLLVPVIRDVDKKNMVQLSRELEELAARARDRKISLDELKGGTSTISNQGGIGGDHFTPIINKPEVAILGVGRSGLKAVVKEGRIEPRQMLPLALSYDHRVIDGGSAARFTVDLVKAIENFTEEEMTAGTT